MKRKIIALISSVFLMIPFIIPVYAEETYYWDGTIFSTTANTVEENLVGNFINEAKRVRFNYLPTYTVFASEASTNASSPTTAGIYYFWFTGIYSSASQSNDDQIFKLRLHGYIDSVSAGSNIYTSTEYKGSSNSFKFISIQHGSDYYHFFGCNPNLGGSFKALLNNSIITVYGNHLDTASGYGQVLSVALGFDTNYSRFTNVSSPSTGFLYNSVSAASNNYSDFRYASNVYTAFGNEISTPIGGNGNIPSSGYGDGSGNGSGSGSGSGSEGEGSGTGSGGYQVITFEDGAISQQQQQMIEEGAVSSTSSAVVESDAVNVTVNNSDGLTPEGIEAVDTLLQNQGVNTSFNDAISNINGFRQLGVAFAGTVSVFLGWLPAWVTSLLALMFTILFFFIILRLLKVFHG